MVHLEDDNRTPIAVKIVSRASGKSAKRSWVWLVMHRIDVVPDKLQSTLGHILIIVK